MENETKNLEENLEKIFIPKVKFETPTVESEADMIYNFSLHKNPSIDFSKTVYKRHPKLKEMVSEITDEEEFRSQCDKYVSNYIEENKEIIEKAKENFQKSWEEIGNNLLTSLSKDFETKLPEEVSLIKANVSINPICPRWIDKWTYNLYYKFTNEVMREVSIHEIIHFLYFKKWSEVFPDSNKENYNGLHPEWILSEILVHSIMNNNKTIQGIINNKTDVYQKWQSIRIDGKKLPELFEDFYKQHEEGEISFADFLKKSWNEYNKYKKDIENKIIK